MKLQNIDHVIITSVDSKTSKDAFQSKRLNIGRELEANVKFCKREDLSAAHEVSI